MKYRQLGKSGLRVSVISMGTMTYGGKTFFAAAGSGTVDDAKRQISLCVDAGVNLIDTANGYSGGLCEEIIGEALQATGRRQDVILATKVRYPTGRGPNDRGLSRHHIIRECEKSLKRLRTDVIDLYQTHQWDGITPLEETLEALTFLQRQGKVQYIGSCNLTAWQLAKALKISALDRLSAFISQQIHYTCEAREAENELVPISLDEGLGLLVWSPLAGGLLSGRYRRDISPPDGRRVAGWQEPPIYDENRLWRIVDVLVQIGDAHGVSAAQVALAWVLAKPGVTSVIVGGRKDEQFVDNIAAADLELHKDEVEEIELVSGGPLPYPHWHQATTVADLLGPIDLAQLGRHLKTR
jgi:aryl-alcohol dehydrogenase-like predicted oxidoreductase